MARVVTFGEIMLRLTPCGYDRFFQNDQMRATFGGAEANVAVSLSNFGVDSRYVTKVPDNPVGHAAVSCLRSFGVDISKIIYGGERLGIYFLEKGASQRGSVCVYDRAHSAIRQAAISDFDWDSVFEGADWFHFSGITPALGDNLIRICKEACVEAKKRNITISCDLNYREKLWPRNLAGKVMSDLCRYVDVCIANETDAKDIFGISAGSADRCCGRLNSEEYQSVAKQLADQFGFHCVAITLRSSFSASDNDWSGMLYDGRQAYFSRNYSLHIVDRVGGGDSFAAGLIYSMLEQMPPQEAVEFAAAASALKHSIEGDFNRVCVAEVQSLIDGGGSGRIQR